MRELWGVLVLGVLFWVLLAWLPFSVDPGLFVVLVLGVATAHEWMGLVVSILLGAATEALFLLPPGIYLTSYVMAFTTLRFLAHHFHLDAIWTRCLAATCGASVATLAVKQLYLHDAVAWRAIASLADGLSLALTVVVAAAVVPMLSAWCDGKWQRPHGLPRP